MGSSDNFCLRWNDFESNISTSFRELRDDSEFFDVTLCCDNGTDIVPAHKVILAACSPLFRKILSRQKNQQNPFLYLKGIHLKEMKAVLNFMYHGEVNVAQDSLNNFLAVAEELAVKGLTTDSKPAGTDTPAKKAVVSQKQKRSLPPGSSSTPQAAKKPKPSQSNTPSEDIEIEPHLEDVDIKSIKAEPEPSGSGSGVGPGGSHAAMVEADLGDESYGASGAGDDDNGDFGAEGEFEGFDQYGEGNEFDDSMGAAGGSGAAADGKVLDVDEQVRPFFGRTNQGLYQCNGCGDVKTAHSNLRNHIEAKHLHLKLICKFCRSIFRTRLNFQMHLKIHMSQDNQLARMNMRNILQYCAME